MSRIGSWRRITAVAAVSGLLSTAVFLGLSAPSLAAASPGHTGFSGISCPAAGSCVAAGPITAELDHATWFTGSPLQWEGQTLSDIWLSCPVPGWCGASGYVQTSSPPYGSGVLATLDGGAWSFTTPPTSQLSPQPVAGSATSMAAISCPAVRWCVAVGSYGNAPGSAPDALIATYARGAWSAITAPLDGVSQPGAGSPVGSLVAVSCWAISACVAVGSWSDSTGGGGLIERLSAGRWTAESAPTAGLSPPLPSGTSLPLTRVVCASAASCAAFSEGSGAARDEALYTDTDGVWTAEWAPLVGLSPPAGQSPELATGGLLESLACGAPGSCTAVGAYVDTAGNHLGLIETLVGGKWRPSGAAPSAGMPYPAANPNVFLHDVSCTSRSSCVAVGNYWGGNFVERLSYGVWTPSTIPLTGLAPPGTSSYFGGVSCATPTWCVAGGEAWVGNGVPLLASFNGTSWSPILASSAPSPSCSGMAQTTATSGQTYTLTGAGSDSWQPIDTTSLCATAMPLASESLLLIAEMGVAASGGVNADVGLFEADDGGAPHLIAWKEAGASTSPRNLSLQWLVPGLVPGHTYAFSLWWRASASDITGWMGTNGPTTLAVRAVASPASSFTLVDDQPRLDGSDGSTWQTVDPNLSTVITPSSDSMALLSANADLWTDAPGYGQDLGIFIRDGSGPDALVSWTESGGATAFASNATTVVAARSLTGGHAYTVTIKWKTNRPTHGGGASIFAGAGPMTGAYSPSDLFADIIPSGTEATSAMVTSQPELASSAPATWQQVESGPVLSVTAASTHGVVLSAEADVWAMSSFVTDVGVMVSDQGRPGVVLGWAEAGADAAYTPSSTMVSTAYTLVAGHTYVVSLVWRDVSPAGRATILAGAGPIGAGFSPTWLVAAPG